VSPVTLAAGDREVEEELLIRYSCEGDLSARRELVERLVPFARKLARRYTYTGEPFDDLFQVACLGLLKAIDRYEPSRGSKFTSYAAPTIMGELKRHFRDRVWAMYVPRDLKERVLAVTRAADDLGKTLGRSPKPLEVSRAVGCSLEEVREAYEAARAYEITSLDRAMAPDEDASAPLIDLIAKDDGSYELADERMAIARTWSTLPEIERRTLELRFVHDLTQREIGERIGYSQMHVSRLLRRALARFESDADATPATRAAA
jgi:RNA polymerase sigma-B factor